MRIKAIVNREDARQHDYIKFLEDNFPQLMTEKDPELYYVIGGDGAMHYAHKDLSSENIPFFGKGFGTLNFIMNNFDNDKEIIQKLLDDDIKLSVIETNKITVTVYNRNNKQIAFKKAINDIVIGEGIMDYHELIINSERGAFDDLTFLGMGICLSSPLGSTAFNINNYGKVLPLDSNIWSITSVVGDHRINEVMMPQKITIDVRSTRKLPSLYVDGTATKISLATDDKIVINKTEEVFKIAFLDGKEFHKKRMKLIQQKR